MARYIDADKLLKILYEKWLNTMPNRTCFFLDGQIQRIAEAELIEKVMKEIEKQPTADVVEVVQSLWKKTANEKPASTRHLIMANGSLISHYGYYLKPKDKWYKTYECEEEIEVPTYWMDMPDPPKESIYGECAVMDGKKVE